MIGISDAPDVFIGQFAVNTVNERSHLAAINEERLTVPCTPFTVALATFVASQEPQTDRNLCAVKELAG